MRASRLSKYSIVKLYQNAAKMRPARRRLEVVRNPSLKWIRDYEYPTSFGADSGGSVAVIRMITGQRASGIRPFSPVSYELSVNGKVVGTFENERKAFGAAERMLAPQSPESIPDRPVDAALKEASTTMGAALLSGTSELVSKETAISESKWSQYQRDIFAFIRDGVGNAIIEAVAGSGKTTTIMESLKYIPRNKSVLILAFNKSIELELKQRVPDGHNVNIQTLTAFGFTFLRQYWKNEFDKKIQWKRDASVIQEGIGRDFDILTQTKEGLELVGKVSDLVALCQSYLVRSDDEITAIQNDHRLLVDTRDEETAQAWSFDASNSVKFQHEDVLRWVKASLRAQLMKPDDGEPISFRDMVYVPAMHPEWPSQRLYDFVFVDETQDTDVAQLSLVMRAVKPGGRIICVGDRRQSIYRFRGADDEAMPRMQKRLDAKLLPLSFSYRVPQCSAIEAQKIVPGFRVPEGTPPGICAEVTAERMIENWQIGDIVIGRINAPLLSLALIALAQGKLPLIMGEGDQIQKILNRVIDSVAKKMSFKDRSVEAMYPLIDEWADQERQQVIDRVVRKKRAMKWNEYDVYDKETGTKISNFLVGIENEIDYKFAGIAAEALKEIIARPDISSIADLKEFIKKIAPDDEDLEGMNKQDPDKFKKLRKTRIVFTSAHRIKGGEGRRIFVLEETFSWGRNGKRGKREMNEKETTQEQNLWYVAVTRVMHQRADEKKGIPARDGEMYYVTNLDNLVGRLPNQETKKKTEADR